MLYDRDRALENHLSDLAWLCDRGISRPPRTMRQWVEQELVIPDGPEAGERYRHECQPINRLWLDAVDSGNWTEHVYTGPSQSGKSLFGYVVPLLYHICERAEKVVFAVPLEEMANDKYQADIKPVMMASANLRQIMPTSGSGSAGGTVRDLITFNNSAMAKIATAGGSDQGKAGFTARVVCVTELAGFTLSTGGSQESDPLRQLRARQKAYDYLERATFLEGTKQTSDTYPWLLRAESTQSTIPGPCPNCGEFVTPGLGDFVGWESARTEIEAEEIGHWRCPKCLEPITESERRSMVQDAVLLHAGQTVSKNGKISGPLPQTRRLWFDYGAFHNMFTASAGIATELWAASKIDPDSPQRASAEKAITQFTFGTIYEPPAVTDAEIVTADGVRDRRLALPRGVVPDDTAILTFGGDLGQRVGHYVILATRTNGGLHVCDYGTFDVVKKSISHLGEVEKSLFIDRAIAKALEDLHMQLSTGVVTESGERRLIQEFWIDRGWHPAGVLRFAKTQEKWMPVLGRGETQIEKTLYRSPNKRSKTVRRIDPDGRYHITFNLETRTEQATVDVDAFKRLIANSLIQPVGSEGAISLFSGPKTVHDRISKHWASEQEVLEEVPGQVAKKRWIRSGANHFLDALCYAIAAAYKLGYQPSEDESQATW
jgi:phage terminase large subunit GpA-like protein